VLDNVKKCGYDIPTPIQAYSIPAILTNHDVIGVAQTGEFFARNSALTAAFTHNIAGSGKTGAMLIPVISKLMGKAKKLAAPRPGLGYDPARDRVRAEPLVLVIAPTRELCCQIFDEARRLCYRSMLRPCVAYGGAPLREQAAQLNRGCDILIASPGRLIDFMSRPNVLSLARLRYTIIDEADEMLHDDWGDDMAKIMGGGGKWRVCYALAFSH
jgi:ATP-dependent RNA helicase DDX3X